MGITKQSKKVSPTAWKTVWLGFEINTKECTLAIPQEKEEATLLQIQDDLFDDIGGLMPFADTAKLGKLVGIFCHMSQGWAMGKTLLWPLYKLLSCYREYDKDGKLRYRKAQAKLNSNARDSIMEWYTRINTCGIYKKFYTCLGAHATTKVGLWCVRATKKSWNGKKSTKGWKTIPGTKEIKMVSTWGEEST